MEKAPIPEPTRIRWRRIAPTLLIVWIVSMLDKSNMSIVMNDRFFLRELHLVGQQTKLGWLSSGLFVAYATLAPLWGWAVRRLGPRLVGVASLLIWSIACVWSGRAHAYDELLASRILLGAGEAALFPLTLALVANWFPISERGRATAFWWIGTMIGPMLVGVSVTGLITLFGWRWQFFVMALLSLTLPLPMIWRFVRDRPAEHALSNAQEAHLVATGSLESGLATTGKTPAPAGPAWNNSRFWLMTVAIAGNNIFFWGWSIWLPTYLRTERGFSFSTAGSLSFVTFGCALVVILLVGSWSDRLRRRAPLAAGGWLLACGFLLAATMARSPVASVILMVCALCAQQTGIASGEILMHSVIKASDMPQSQGVRALLTQLAGAGAPAMVGYLIERTGSFSAGFYVLACAVSLAAVCMLKLAWEGY